MISGYILFLLGTSGILILYSVLAHLSSRMGEGLRLPGYYRIYYLAIIFLLLAELFGWYLYNGEGSEDTIMIFLISGNILSVIASYKYWWWLKDELWIKKYRGEE